MDLMAVHALTPADRPNLLLICADQLAREALPAYGGSYAHTPNIDRLADRGVRFDRCYTPCPLCQPARASFWTGRFPHETGVRSNGIRDHVPDVPADMSTMGELLSAAGYQCVHFGKRHDAGALRGFEIAESGELPVDAPPQYPAGADSRRDRYTAQRAVEFLKTRRDDRPLLIAVDFVNPHDICSWIGHNQGPHEDLPPGRPLPPLPDNFEDADLHKRPRPVQYICCGHNRLAQASQWTPDNYRHYLAAYYHYLEQVDAEIGRVLDALERSPIAGNTLVVFFSDHGEGLASHRMVTKQVSFYEQTTCVPMIFSGSGVHGAGRLANPLVSLLDLLPTVCDYAGATVPDGLWGRSLRPWIEADRPGSPHDYVACEWYTEWGFTIEPGRMIRTDRFKYTRYLEADGEELYDLHADPGETRTLVDDRSYQSVLQNHRDLLDRHLSETRDDFASLNWLAEPRWREHPIGYMHHRGLAAPEANQMR
jgi:choline-sulfatase